MANPVFAAETTVVGFDYTHDVGLKKSATLLQAPEGMIIISVGGGFCGGGFCSDYQIQWTPASGQQGTYTVIVRTSAPSPTGGLIYVNNDFDVEVINRKPSITSSPATSITPINSPYNYAVTALDEDSDPLTYSLVQSPVGMSIDSGTGEISWTPDQAGFYAVEINVVDGFGGSASQSYTLVVTDASTAFTGFIPGEFSVDQSGSTNYKVPVVVPPGTAGMQPSLSLNYNGRSGNGVLGRGWTLGGLSVITRCPATRAQDGFIDGVNFDSNDRFCIDGQRLISISGTYGADGTEYRTELDSFTKVISYGTAGNGPEKFKVWTKAGQIMQYGYTADSRIEAQGMINVRLWAVNRIEDTVGNYLSISYIEDNNYSEYLPDRIDYTGNDAATLTPYASVQFNYLDRPDITPLYFANSLVQTSKRLDSIETYVGEDLVRHYRLNYDNTGAVGQSRLVSIAECVGLVKCTQPTIMDFQNSGDNTFGSIIYSSHGDSNQDSDVSWPDINGDGLADWARNTGSKTRVRLSNGDGTFGPIIDSSHGASSQDTYVSWVDINADGLTDWVRNTGSKTRVRLGNGDGTFGSIIDSSHGASSQDTNVSWVDINGDGLPDWVRADGSKTRVRLGNGDGTFGSIIDSPHGESGQSSDVAWVDVNGDGLADWVRHADVFPNLLIRVRLSNGDGTFGAIIDTNQGYLDRCTKDTGVTQEIVSWADVNGDGMADWTCAEASRTRVRLGKGDGTFGSVINSNHGVTSPYGSTSQQEDVSWVDMNGDGMADWVRTDSGSTQVRLSFGDGTFGPIVISSHGANGQTKDVSWADVNGDGIPDWAMAEDSETRVRLSNNVMPDLLLSVTEGNGKKTQVTHKSLVDTTVYTKGTAATYPEIDLIHSGAYVVSSVSVDDGIGGQRETTYTYSEAKADVDRGYLGFASMSATDTGTGITTTASYSQTWPFVSYATHIEQRLSDNTLIGETDTTYATTQTHASVEYPAGDGSVYPHTTQVVKKDYELDGSLITTTTTDNVYDAFGNPTSIAVAITDGTDTYTTETVNTYSNDDSNWILGRLTRAEVMQTNADLISATRVSSFAYDATTGLLTQEKVEPDITTLTLTKDYTYDAFGNRIAVTVSGIDITSRTTSTAYDARGQFAISITNALNHSETRTYDDHFGVLTSLTGPNNLTTTWTYDDFGRQEQETRADGTTTTITREWCDGYLGLSGNTNCPTGGALVQTTQVSGAPTTVAYSDLLGQVIREETQGFDGTPIYVDTQYDALGRITQKSRAYFSGDTVYWTSFTYDILGRVLTATAPDSSVTSSTYDGLTTSVTNDLNQTNARIKNARGELVRVVDADSNVTDYSYDPVGNLIEVEDTQFNVTSSTYDIRGRKTSMDDPDMGSWTYSYNVLGELVSQTDAKGQTVTMSYDLLGRIVSRTEPEGTSSWTYDTATNGIGKLHTSSGAGGDTQTVSYDSFGRPSSTVTIVDSENFTISQTYDAAGRVDTITYPASVHYPTGLVVQNNYNAQGYLDSVENVSTSLVYWEADTMNAEGQLTHETLGNGITTQHTYNSQTGLVSAITSSTPFGTFDVQDLAYTFDTIGNLTQRQDLQQNLSETFVYDVLNRMTSSTLDDGTTQTTKNYSYDALGNILSKTGIGSYTYGEGGVGAHAVTTAGGHSIGYDDNGNMTSSWNFTSSQARSVSYTSYNKPAEIVQGSTTIDFAYDINRNLVKQVTQLASGTATRLYIGSLYERDVAGSLVTHIHHIKVGNTTVALYKSKSDDTEQVRYLHRDHLGSITEISDEIAQVTEQLSYDPHGKRRNIDWTDALAQIFAFETKRSFTGHLYVDDVGLINMGGRFYDPDLGRFMSPDPVIQEPANAQSLNRYTYVLNNPLSFTDPSGFFFGALFKAIKSIVKAVVGAVNSIIKGVTNLINSITGGNQFLNMVIAAIAAWYTGGLASSSYLGSITSNTALIGAQTSSTAAYVAATTTANIIRGAVGGFVSGAIIGGDIKSALIGGFTGAAIMGANAYFGQEYTIQNAFPRILTKGVIGGISQKLQGGKFIDGFKSGALIETLGVSYKLAETRIDRLTTAVARKLHLDLEYHHITQQLLSDGVTPPFDVNGNPVDYSGDFFEDIGIGGMCSQFEPDCHFYSEGGYVQGFINAVSKIHDALNSINYHPTAGGYIDRGYWFNSAFAVYNFSGMVPAAAYTIVSYPASNGILQNVALEENRR